MARSVGNFFGRIRSLNKSPDSKQLEENFRRVAFTDLLSPVLKQLTMT